MIEALSENDIRVEDSCGCWTPWMPLSKPKPDCVGCEGRGYYLTAFGEAIIDMLRHQGLVAAASEEKEE